jgi:hypothetical protein
MSEAAFVLLKNIFERSIKKCGLESQYTTARFYEVWGGNSLLACFALR